jgi:hypothetical protein
MSPGCGAGLPAIALPAAITKNKTEIANTFILLLPPCGCHVLPLQATFEGKIRHLPSGT